MFTADYYLANPDAYLGKEVTLSVSSLNPRNEQPREDGLCQLDAQHSISTRMAVLLWYYAACDRRVADPAPWH